MLVWQPYSVGNMTICADEQFGGHHVLPLRVWWRALYMSCQMIFWVDIAVLYVDGIVISFASF